MTQIWVVRCSHCRNGVTICTPPKHVGFSRWIRCASCNETLDANKGVFRRVNKPNNRVAKKQDLLRVG